MSSSSSSSNRPPRSKSAPRASSGGAVGAGTSSRKKKQPIPRHVVPLAAERFCVQDYEEQQQQQHHDDSDDPSKKKKQPRGKTIVEFQDDRVLRHRRRLDELGEHERQWRESSSARRAARQQLEQQRRSHSTGRMRSSRSRVRGSSILQEPSFLASPVASPIPPDAANAVYGDMDYHGPSGTGFIPASSYTSQNNKLLSPHRRSRSAAPATPDRGRSRTTSSNSWRQGQRPPTEPVFSSPSSRGAVSSSGESTPDCGGVAQTCSNDNIRQSVRSGYSFAERITSCITMTVDTVEQERSILIAEKEKKKKEMNTERSAKDNNEFWKENTLDEGDGGLVNTSIGRYSLGDSSIIDTLSHISTADSSYSWGPKQLQLQQQQQQFISCADSISTWGPLEPLQSKAQQPERNEKQQEQHRRQQQQQHGGGDLVDPPEIKKLTRQVLETRQDQDSPTSVLLMEDNEIQATLLKSSNPENSAPVAHSDVKSDVKSAVVAHSDVTTPTRGSPRRPVSPPRRPGSPPRRPQGVYERQLSYEGVECSPSGRLFDASPQAQRLRLHQQQSPEGPNSPQPSNSELREVRLGLFRGDPRASPSPTTTRRNDPKGSPPPTSRNDPRASPTPSTPRRDDRRASPTPTTPRRNDPRASPPPTTPRRDIFSGSPTPTTPRREPDGVSSTSSSKCGNPLQNLESQDKSVVTLQKQVWERGLALKKSKRELEQSRVVMAKRSQAFEEASANIFRERIVVEERLRKEMESNETFKKQLTYLQQEVSRLGVAIDKPNDTRGGDGDATKAIERLSADLLSLRSEVVDLRAQLAEAKAATLAKDKEISVLRRERDEARTQLSALNEKFRNLEREAITLRARAIVRDQDDEAVGCRVNEELRSLQIALEESNRQVAEQFEKSKYLEEELSEAKVATMKHEVEVTDLREHLKTTRLEADNKLNVGDSETRLLQNELQRIKDKLSQTNSEIINQAAVHLKERGRLENELEQTKKVAEVLQIKVSSMDAQLAESEVDFEMQQGMDNSGKAPRAAAIMDLIRKTLDPK